MSHPVQKRDILPSQELGAIHTCHDYKFEIISCLRFQYSQYCRKCVSTLAFNTPVLTQRNRGEPSAGIRNLRLLFKRPDNWGQNLPPASLSKPGGLARTCIFPEKERMFLFSHKEAIHQPRFPLRTPFLICTKASYRLDDALFPVVQISGDKDD